jgi:hypothetical protein
VTVNFIWGTYYYPRSFFGVQTLAKLYRVGSKKEKIRLISVPNFYLGYIAQDLFFYKHPPLSSRVGSKKEKSD